MLHKMGLNAVSISTAIALAIVTLSGCTQSGALDTATFFVVTLTH